LLESHKSSFFCSPFRKKQKYFAHKDWNVKCQAKWLLCGTEGADSVAFVYFEVLAL